MRVDPSYGHCLPVTGTPRSLALAPEQPVVGQVHHDRVARKDGEQLADGPVHPEGRLQHLLPDDRGSRIGGRHPGEAAHVLRRRDGRAVRRREGVVQEERGVGRDCVTDEGLGLLLEHVGDVVLERSAAVVEQLPTGGRHPVVVVGTRVRGEPLVPARRDVGILAAQISVEVLADHGRAVALLLEVHRDRVLVVERLEAAVGAAVVPDARGVAVVTGQDRGPRRTAQRVRHERVGEGGGVPRDELLVDARGERGRHHVEALIVRHQDHDVRVRRRRGGTPGDQDGPGEHEQCDELPHALAFRAREPAYRMPFDPGRAYAAQQA